MEHTLRDGGRIHHDIDGTGGPWLVLLNGLMMSTASWQPLVEALSRDHRVLRLDFRDQGRSSHLQTGYRAEQHVADLCELLDHLHIGRAHVLGVSYGGQVALSLMRTRPQRVASLVLASITAQANPYLEAVGAAWKVAARRRDAREFFDLCMPYVYGPAFYERAGDWLAQRRELLAGVLDDAWFVAFERLADSATGFDYADVPATIDVPTALICGTEDSLTPMAEMRCMGAAIRDCRLFEIEGAGHGAVLEDSAAFTDATLSHLHRVAGARLDGAHACA